jgi:hypothetical protein
MTIFMTRIHNHDTGVFATRCLPSLSRSDHSQAPVVLLLNFIPNLTPPWSVTTGFNPNVRLKVVNKRVGAEKLDQLREPVSINCEYCCTAVLKVEFQTATLSLDR